jgi:hypothetical protein
MAPEKQRVPADLRGYDVHCADCSASLEIGRDRPVATDGGVDRPDRADAGRTLRGIDVECATCGSEIGVYFFE